MAKHLTLSDSSCEAEYKELAKYVKGVKFAQMLLGKLRLRELPGVLFEDNSGSIFLAQNKQVSKRTKHMDLKHHLSESLRNAKMEFSKGKYSRSSLSLIRPILERRMLKLGCSKGMKKR